MAYLRPCPAKNTGSSALNSAIASRRALATAAKLAEDLIGIIADRLSSSAIISAIDLRNASAFRGDNVRKWACIATRTSTIAALGGGISSGCVAFIDSDITVTPTPRRAILRSAPKGRVNHAVPVRCLNKWSINHALRHRAAGISANLLQVPVTVGFTLPAAVSQRREADTRAATFDSLTLRFLGA